MRKLVTPRKTCAQFRAFVFSAPLLISSYCRSVYLNPMGTIKHWVKTPWSVEQMAATGRLRRCCATVACPRLALQTSPAQANCNELLNLIVNRLNRLVISASTGLTGHAVLWHGETIVGVLWAAEKGEFLVGDCYCQHSVAVRMSAAGGTDAQRTGLTRCGTASRSPRNRRSVMSGSSDCDSVERAGFDERIAHRQ